MTVLPLRDRPCWRSRNFLLATTGTFNTFGGLLCWMQWRSLRSLSEVEVAKCRLNPTQHKIFENGGVMVSTGLSTDW